MPSTSTTWYLANQAYLMEAIAEVQFLLEQTAAQIHADVPQPEPVIPLDLPFPDDQPPALDILVRLFDLSEFECQLLLLCAGVEISQRLRSLCVLLQGDPQSAYATFSLALSLFPEADWGALTPKASLRRWRLLEVGGGNVLTHSPLRIDERILHFLLGQQQLDERLTGLVTPASRALLTEILLPPSYQNLAQAIAQTNFQQFDVSTPAIQLYGPDSLTKQTIAAAACAASGLALQVVTVVAWPRELSQFNLLQCLCEREARLGATAFLLDCHDLAPMGNGGGDGGGPSVNDATVGLEELIQRLLESLHCPLLISSRDRRSQRHRPLISYEIQPPTQAEQQHLWQQLLGDTGVAQLNGQLDHLVTTFKLTPATIQAVTKQVLPQIQAQIQARPDTQPERIATLDSPQPTNHDHDKDHGNEFWRSLWEACLMQARLRLADLGQPIRAAASWEDLVLPDREIAVLQAMVAHIRQRSTVYDTWGFAKKSWRGLGISALFAGPSGTGKTLAAEVLAHALNLDLYRIDLSAVVSKYIGETEKNLRRIFDAAETGSAVLLFDEADALFGKRSEVKDSHDRYANLEVAYLLQRIEAYQGLAILTTNLKDSLDQAFLRRIRFIVQFPFPDVEQRVQIWQRVFPQETPTQDLQYRKLAKLSVTGGNIRNIALNAAFLAADAQEPVQMKHILQAAQGEYIKLERQLTDQEIKGWLPPA
ncbi:MAG: ATP-binding protein [Cyanobacteria bacterium P01_H01_bin.121]